jgi:hypothetical protein
MMEDVLVKLNPGLPWQKLNLTRGIFLLAKRFRIEKEASKILQLEYRFLWY